MNLLDIYLQRFDPPKFDTKHALKCLDCCALVRCKAFLFQEFSLNVLETKFFVTAVLSNYEAEFMVLNL